MRLLKYPASYLFSCFVSLFHKSYFRRGAHRKAACLALILSLLIWPGPDPAFQQLPVMAASAIEFVSAQARQLSWLLTLLFRARPRQDTPADRMANVSRIEISPAKFVGYESDRVPFSAIPVNFAGEIVQGVKLEWDSSALDRALIDETGMATPISPGLSWIICRAGSLERRVPLLVLPGKRPDLSDEQWKANQSLLSEDGSLKSATGGAARLLPSLLDKLAPVARAQNGGGCVGGDSRDIYGTTRSTQKARVILKCEN